ncbi:MAG: hypothetical protein ACTSU9_19875 [Promethearchaeota archaeon]
MQKDLFGPRSKPSVLRDDPRVLRDDPRVLRDDPRVLRDDPRVRLNSMFSAILSTIS